MADGNTIPFVEDGVYLDLPLWQYLADPALSGSAFKALLVDPPSWKWDRPDNPLRERVETRPQLRGSAAHCAILEGLDTYARRYCIAPNRGDYPGALDTADDMKAWLRARDLKISGAKAELVERILEAADDEDPPVFWEDLEGSLIAGRASLKVADDAYVRMLARFVHSDPAFAPLVSGGLPEVSIFWTEDGHRLKARLDYINPLGVLDLKTFGQPPMQGRTLLQHVLREAAMNGYDIQAVHNWRAAQWMADAVRGGDTEIIGAGDAWARIERLTEVAHAIGPETPFHWLFVRMGSYPSGVGVRFAPRDQFDNPDAVWAAALRKIETATEAFDAYAETCGDGPWMRSDGIVRADVSDWPIWVGDIAGDLR